MKRVKLERKAYALLGSSHAPLHKWHPAKRGGWVCRHPGCGAKSPHVDDKRACLPRVPHQTMLEIVRLPNDLGNAIGERNEQRTLKMILAFRTSEPAIIDARLATKDEDANGIDIVVRTAFGDMFVQVKSNKTDARLWRRKYVATIGHKTVLVRWDGDRIAAPTNLREALQETYTKLTQPNESHVTA